MNPPATSTGELALPMVYLASQSPRRLQLLTQWGGHV
jgi:hypothetical protein